MTSKWRHVANIIACILFSLTFADDSNMDQYRCEFIDRNAADLGLTQCQYSQRFCVDQIYGINYYALRYCTPGWFGHMVTLPLVLFVTIVLLILLSDTVQHYFVPILKSLSGFLKLPPSVAGVTLLAFGNSATDVFTAVAGVRTSDIPFVLSAIIGGGVCVTTLCLGFVICASPAKVEHGVWLIRDIAVYLIATALIVMICQSGKVYMWQASAFLLLYFLYAAAIVSTYFLTPRSIPVRVLSLSGLDDGLTYSLLTDEQPQRLVQSSEFGCPKQVRIELFAPIPGGAQPLPLYDFGPDHRNDFGDSVFDDSESSSREDSLYESGQIFACFFRSAQEGWNLAVTPYTWLRRITIPVATGEFTQSERSRLCVMPFFALPLIVLAFTSTLSAALFTIPIGATLAVLAWRIFPLQSRPLPLWSLSLIGFVTSMAWISLLASELVSAIQALGAIVNVSVSALGVTAFAFANSVSDLVTNSSVARSPSGSALAIAACFGAPIMNGLLGLGLSFAVACSSTYPSPVTFSTTPHIALGWSFLILSLFTNAFGFIAYRFRPPSAFGIILILFYVVFVAVSIAFI